MRRSAERPLRSIIGCPGNVLCRSFSIWTFQLRLLGCHGMPLRHGSMRVEHWGGVKIYQALAFRRREAQRVRLAAHSLLVH